MGDWKRFLKELVVNEICCMDQAQTTLKLQVRETFSGAIVRESAADFFSSRGHESRPGIFEARNLMGKNKKTKADEYNENHTQH